MQRYKQLSPFNVHFTRTNKTCTETNELQYSIQNDTAYNTTSTIPPASFPVVLGDFGCDVTLRRHPPIIECPGKFATALGSKHPHPGADKGGEGKSKRAGKYIWNEEK